MKPKLYHYLLLALAISLAVRPLIGNRATVVSGPADRVVAVYESLNQPVAEASVMGGLTVQAIDKAGKWRQYDKNEIPASEQAILLPVVAKYGIPCLALIRGGAVTASVKFPPSDAELSAFIQSHGGY